MLPRVNTELRQRGVRDAAGQPYGVLQPRAASVMGARMPFRARGIPRRLHEVPDPCGCHGEGDISGILLVDVREYRADRTQELGRREFGRRRVPRGQVR